MFRSSTKQQLIFLSENFWNRDYSIHVSFSHIQVLIFYLKNSTIDKNINNNHSLSVWVTFQESCADDETIMQCKNLNRLFY